MPPAVVVLVSMGKFREGNERFFATKRSTDELILADLDSKVALVHVTADVKKTEEVSLLFIGARVWHFKPELKGDSFPLIVERNGFEGGRAV